MTDVSGDATATAPAPVMWTPPADLRETTEIGRFMAWLASNRGLDFASYDELWKWSVADLEGFWGAVAEFFEIRFRAPYERVLADRSMPGARWFEGAELNYAEHLVGRDEDRDANIAPYDKECSCIASGRRHQLCSARVLPLAFERM